MKLENRARHDCITAVARAAVDLHKKSVCSGCDLRNAHCFVPPKYAKFFLELHRCKSRANSKAIPNEACRKTFFTRFHQERKLVRLASRPHSYALANQHTHTHTSTAHEPFVSNNSGNGKLLTCTVRECKAALPHNSTVRQYSTSELRPDSRGQVIPDLVSFG